MDNPIKNWITGILLLSVLAGFSWGIISLMFYFLGAESAIKVFAALLGITGISYAAILIGDMWNDN